MFKGEKVFKGEREVKYLFQKSYKKASNLIIVFSAFPAMGKNPRYNYVNTLSTYDCNKLFILDDFGCRASYYLCENRDFSIERSVTELINWIIQENDIKNIMSCGSSKGGYAALYYGIKYGFDHIVVASPQYFIGDYLLEQTNSNNVSYFMSGSDQNEDKEFLNKIMKNMIDDSSHKPNIFIHLGKGEYHYKSHVLPLVKHLESNNINYELDLGDYSQHNDVIKFYPAILKKKVREIFHYPFLEFKTEIDENVPLHSSVQVEVETNSTENKVAWYFYLNGNKIDTQNYSFERTYLARFRETGTYIIKAFAVNTEGLRTIIASKKIAVS